MDMDTMTPMKLIIDEKNVSYYYVHELDHSIRLSPSFDYLEDAEQWKQRMMEILEQSKRSEEHTSELQSH